ncbi:MAG: hypothetical protein L0Z53_17445 [Acidobacteriales bacterium]|nr:hypothetical protein [Terriglobales bacterium]
MTFRKIAGLSLRLASLTLLLAVCLSLGSLVVGAQAGAGQQEPVSPILLLLVCFLDVAVLSFIILRSRGSGWKLIAAVWLAFFWGRLPPATD